MFDISEKLVLYTYQENSTLDKEGYTVALTGLAMVLNVKQQNSLQ